MSGGYSITTPVEALRRLFRFAEPPLKLPVHLTYRSSEPRNWMQLPHRTFNEDKPLIYFEPRCCLSRGPVDKTM